MTRKLPGRAPLDGSEKLMIMRFLSDGSGEGLSDPSSVTNQGVVIL
jgi:hypothetical protein